MLSLLSALAMWSDRKTSVSMQGPGLQDPCSDCKQYLMTKPCSFDSEAPLVFDAELGSLQAKVKERERVDQAMVQFALADHASGLDTLFQVPLVSITFIFVGSYYKALYTNCRGNCKSMVLIVERRLGKYRLQGSQQSLVLSKLGSCSSKHGAS